MPLKFRPYIRLVQKIEQVTDLHILPALVVVLALHLYRHISRIGLLRGLLLPNRRSLRVHFIGDRRRVSIPGWLILVHFLATLITWKLYPPGVSPWFIPFTWAASLSTTTVLWAFVRRI